MPMLRLKEKIEKFKFLVTAPDLNAHGTLHGGILIKWLDESSGMHAYMLTKGVCATRHIGNVEFIATARIGNIIQIESMLTGLGTTSLEFTSSAKNLTTGKNVAIIDSLTFVHVDRNHKASPHFLTKKQFNL